MSPVTTIDNFESFGLSSVVLDSMQEMGYTTPTPIQRQALPLLLAGAQDFIGLASTGTGKTAAFGIPLIENIDSTTKDTQALVMSPTRELALQVAEQLTLLGKKKGVRVITIYGGSSYRNQLEGIRRGAHIVVATPGRLVDFLEQKYIKLQNVKTVVLDEADEMLSMGFKEDLEFILKATHSDEETSGRAACRTWLFSATMSKEVRRLADLYLENPGIVEVNKVGSAASTIEQVYYTVKNAYKTEVISRLLQTLPEFYGIIFCQTKMEVAELAEVLTQRGFPTDSLHGDKNQQEREATLRKFKSRQVKVIVATDVAARGLDIKDLTHVVNHSMPWDVESYVHRIGRTGRNGQTGVAISLINPEQLNLLRRVMTTTKATLTKGVVPSAEEVAGLKIKDVLDRVEKMDVESSQLILANDLIQDLMEAGEVNFKKLSTEELLARFIVTYFPNVFVKKDLMLDYMGDRIPRELLPRDPQDNRFSRGRDGDSGGGPRRGGGYGGNSRYSGNRGGGSSRRSEGSGGYGNGAPRRDSNRDFGNSERSERNENSGNRSYASGPSSSRPERSERSERGDRDSRPERSSSPAPRAGSYASSDRPARSERSERAPRADHPGINRSRGPKRRSQDH